MVAQWRQQIYSLMPTFWAARSSCGHWPAGAAWAARLQLPRALHRSASPKSSMGSHSHCCRALPAAAHSNPVCSRQRRASPPHSRLWCACWPGLPRNSAGSGQRHVTATATAAAQGSRKTEQKPQQEPAGAHIALPASPKDTTPGLRLNKAQQQAAQASMDQPLAVVAGLC